jgi:hypothetical protein
MKNFGFQTNLELKDILNLTVLPALEIKEGKLNMDSSELMKDIANRYYEQLYGIHTEIKTFESFYKGWDYITEQIAGGKPVIVSGTKYFLNYTKEYKSEKYFKEYGKGVYGICNHWIMIMGFQEDEVYVRDPSFQFIGFIPLEDFKNFWEGDSQFPDLDFGNAQIHRFGSLQIEVDEEQNYLVPSNVAQMGIQKYLNFFLNGRSSESICVGLHAYDKIIELLKDRQSYNFDPKELYNFFHNQKFNLMAVNYVLKQIFSDEKDCVQTLEGCVNLLEEMCMKMYMNMLRKKALKEYKENLVYYLEKLQDMLSENYGKILGGDLVEKELTR